MSDACGSEADIFHMVADGVLDRIMDFEVGVDMLDLRDWNVTSFEDLVMYEELDSSGIGRGRGYIEYGSERIRMDGMTQAEFDAVTVEDVLL